MTEHLKFVPRPKPAPENMMDAGSFEMIERILALMKEGRVRGFVIGAVVTTHGEENMITTGYETLTGVSALEVAGVAGAIAQKILTVFNEGPGYPDPEPEETQP